MATAKEIKLHPDVVERREAKEGTFAFLDSNVAKEEARRRLRAFLHGVSAPFCCGGTVQLNEVAKVRVNNEDDGGGPLDFNIDLAYNYDAIAAMSKEDNKRNLHQLWDLERSARENQVKVLQGLFDCASPALFGKGSETVHDGSVRKARQLPADKFEVNLPDALLDNIIGSIKEKLNIESDIEVKLYSLNMYGKDGFFKTHKDTPRSTNMIGSLILCLPSLFQGGALLVSKGKDKSYFFVDGHSNWKLDRRGPVHSEANPLVVPWAALFSDVDHEITKVHKGLRVTLAYNICLKKSQKEDGKALEEVQPRPLSIESTDQSSGLLRIFQDLIADEGFMPEGHKIGFVCEHLYTNGMLFPGEKTSADALSHYTIRMLKGRDLMIALAAMQANLNVYIVPFLDSENWDGEDTEFEGSGESTYLKKFMPHIKGCNFEDTSMYGERHINEDIAELWVLDHVTGDDDTAKEFYGEQEYWGNESMCSTYFYVRAVLLVEMPAIEKRIQVKKPKVTPSPVNSR